jgi:hypothetical protein
LRSPVGLTAPCSWYSSCCLIGQYADIIPWIIELFNERTWRKVLHKLTVAHLLQKYIRFYWNNANFLTHNSPPPTLILSQTNPFELFSLFHIRFNNIPTSAPIFSMWPLLNHNCVCISHIYIYIYKRSHTHTHINSSDSTQCTVPVPVPLLLTKRHVDAVNDAVSPSSPHIVTRMLCHTDADIIFDPQNGAPLRNHDQNHTQNHILYSTTPKHIHLQHWNKIYIEIFANCNWADTRRQYYFFNSCGNQKSHTTSLSPSHYCKWANPALVEYEASGQWRVIKSQ